MTHNSFQHRGKHVLVPGLDLGNLDKVFCRGLRDPKLLTESDLAFLRAGKTAIRTAVRTAAAMLQKRSSTMLPVTRTSPITARATAALPRAPRYEQPAIPMRAAKPFPSLGEQLQAIMRSASGWPADPRLAEIRAALGANAKVGDAGGFLLQPDFGKDLLMHTYEQSLAGMCTDIPTTASEFTQPAIDETSRADGSRFGGVQAYWADEAGTVTATKPKFKQISLKLGKLMGICYATDELVNDVPRLGDFIGRTFALEMAFKLDNAILRGNGAGRPLGIMNSGALITVSKEAGQAADTIVYENIVTMWARCWGASRKSAVWLVNQDADPQLLTLNKAAGRPVYIAEGTPATFPYPALMGRPVIPCEHCATLGNAGDIVLADLSQYMLAQRAEAASSIHVQFLTDEQVFRFTMRVDGQPMWAAPITPLSGTATLSPFVALEAR